MSSEYPCRTILTDDEFLQHMIPHHQMAINISQQHDKYTCNDIIKALIRDLIRTQSYEIYLMKSHLNNKFDNISAIQSHNPIPWTTMTEAFPNTIELTKTYCDPQFFDPNAHHGMYGKHGNHKTSVSTDKMYIEHMIPHHQVAIDMCKLVMKNTKNDFIIALAYDMLKTQEAEVFLLHNLLKNYI